MIKIFKNTFQVTNSTGKNFNLNLDLTRGDGTFKDHSDRWFFTQSSSFSCFFINSQWIQRECKSTENWKKESDEMMNSMIDWLRLWHILELEIDFNFDFFWFQFLVCNLGTHFHTFVIFQSLGSQRLNLILLVLKLNFFVNICQSLINFEKSHQL